MASRLLCALVLVCTALLSVPAAFAGCPEAPVAAPPHTEGNTVLLFTGNTFGRYAGAPT